ncbi:MAG: DEAD/DEAH box helicase [Planctomycetes bacterium]|nr:DEAD/DEAH box helicase [Planctomycetota bacterium]
MSTFTDLRLSKPILRSIEEQGYDTPTPIQIQAIPHLIEGRDLLGIAQTGTGKTAAFALPILDFLASDPQAPAPRQPSVLVLTPTRELATQISESFRVYGRYLKVRHAVVFGGVNQRPQVNALRQGIDVLVATPGRLIDLMEQGHIDLGAVEIFVLDEADRMLDMGFIHPIRKVVATLPRERQSLLFSATMPPDIVELTRSILRNPLRIEVAPPATTVDLVTQSVLFVEKSDKRELLGEILRDPSIERALVFTRTKHGANRVVKHLRQIGEKADAIHGNKSQGARERALNSFRSGHLRVLVATDIAARGIDVPDITHVINFELPNIPDNYVHRIGRTARAGRNGAAISFCDTDERPYLRDIEKTIRCKITIVEDHPFRSKTPLTQFPNKPASKRKTAKFSLRNRGRGRALGRTSHR